MTYEIHFVCIGKTKLYKIPYNFVWNMAFKNQHEILLLYHDYVYKLFVYPYEEAWNYDLKNRYRKRTFDTAMEIFEEHMKNIQTDVLNGAKFVFWQFIG